MSNNANLRSARNTKNDEFYTQISDIEKELRHYKKHFKDAVVFCNCDDPDWSNFWKYFHLNFGLLGLKKLITTHYNANEPTYKMEYEGGNDSDTSVGEITPLKQNGDFRSPECIELLNEADIVVTNPPFSLFREYVAVLMEHQKKFLIIGNKNAITYKEFFPLLKENKVWLGFGGNIPMTFRMADDYELRGNSYIGEDGHKYTKMGLCRWFTNLDIQKYHEKLILHKKYSPEEFPKYDNYDAINVDKVSDIPVDYDGVMGVPITFLDKYSPEQFEIIGLGCGWNGNSPLITRKYNIHQIQHTWKDGTFKDIQVGKMNDGTPLIKIEKGLTNATYYEVDGELFIRTYGRILIRRR